MMLVERLATGSSEPPSARLVLPYELRCKSRLRTRLESGEEVGLFLPRGQILRSGDRLEAADGRIVEVVAAPEAVMEARSDDPVLLARAAYHLGNRHVPVQIQAGVLRFPQDHVLGDLVRGLGIEVVSRVVPFEPEGGAYGGHAHPYGHSTDGEGRGARIHDMGTAS